MGEAKVKEKAKKKLDSEIDQGLEETFPASDPPSLSEPGGGITSTEPPPKRAGERQAKKG